MFTILWSESSLAKKYLLTHNELKTLNVDRRNSYLKKVGLHLVKLERVKKRKSLKVSFYKLFFQSAFAVDGRSYRCVGGGVILRSDAEHASYPFGQNCGVSEFAGYSCPNNQEICNPVVFGLREESREPLCAPNATTEWCHAQMGVGATSFLTDQEFNQPAVQSDYTRFRSDFEELCDDQAQLLGADRALEQQACEMIRNLTRQNQSRVLRNAVSLNQVTNPGSPYDGVVSEGAHDHGELGDGLRGDGAPSGPYSLHSREYASAFVRLCRNRGVDRQLCEGSISPNTDETHNFRAIYGSEVPHILIPPPDNWENGLQLLQIASEVNQRQGACVRQMANWYRPEPYNSRVGGAGSSHHIGAGAIDIHYCTTADRNRAYRDFLEMESQYPNLGLGTYSDGITIHLDFGTRNYGPRP